MTRNLSGLLIAGTLVMGMAAIAEAQDKGAKQARLLLADGVADPELKVAFYPNPTGGIDALELASGKLLWTSKDAYKPLLATDKRLYAQQKEKGKGNQVRIVVLDTTQQGKRILESQPIVFPDWVTVETALGRSFSSSVRLDATGLYVIWDARAFYASGARPSPEIEAAARKEATGVARIDLDTGKSEPLDRDRITAGKFFPKPAEAVLQQIGGLRFIIRDSSGKNPKNPFQGRRTLQAVNEAKMMVWEHEIAAPIRLPFPP